jgi:hypothetical protein
MRGFGTLSQVAQKAQRRDARRSISGGVLLHVDAQSVESNEAYGIFQQPAGKSRSVKHLTS